MNKIMAVDPEAAHYLSEELIREASTIELIASENFVYESILEAQGSILTNKYAEGYPGNRYHGGCEVIDNIETLAIKRAKDLFGAEHANVQPHSGVNANLAAFLTLLKPGDKILGMNLKHGGHLSHGSKVSISGQFYDSISYGVDRENELIDYDEVERLAKKYRPRLIIAGASAYPRKIDFPRFKEIADKIDAYFMVDMAHIAGLVAAGLHPNPVPYADIVTMTTTKTMRGARGGVILCKEKLAEKVDKSIFPGVQGGPILQNILAKAITFHIAASNEFKDYQNQVLKNSKRMANQLEKMGLRLVSGGTDNHLMLVDLRPWNINGKEAEEALHEVGITVNKNMIPYDPEPPSICSGLRIGTPAISSRGIKEEGVDEIASIIAKVLKDLKNGVVVGKYRDKVEDICKRYPLYFDSLEYSGILRKNKKATIFRRR